MTTPSNAVLESHPGAPGSAQAVVPAARLVYWSVRRELWENRSIYIAPLAAAGLLLFAFLISLMVGPHKLSGWAALDPAKQRSTIEMPYDIAAALIMGTILIVGLFYCLDALYGERRDRSILFWKSLPVSDLTTVLSKLSIPLAILPLLAFAITLATQLIMLLLLTTAVVLGSGSGLSVATLWQQSSFFHVSLRLLYHIVTVHGLWYAPFYGWLLLVSAWARRAPFLWALLPPAVICVVEKIAFNTTYCATLLEHRLAGPETSTPAPGATLMDTMSGLTPAQFFSNPGLWIGAIIAIAFLAIAVRLRRYRGPI